jgi:hypothetical protein
MTLDEVKNHKPTVIFPDEKSNRLI